MRRHRVVSCVLVLASCLGVPVSDPALPLPAEQQAEGGGNGVKDKPLPLEPARTIRFETDEGTWISLDVSPADETIVFELLGDLHTLPITGGEAPRITEGMAFDSQPRYSPDGSKIVFLSDRSGSENVWIMNADGSDPQALTKDEETDFLSPEWTPDGSYIVVSKAGGGQFGPGYKLWLYHVDGGKGVNLTGAEDQRSLNVTGATFGNDPRFVYFAHKQGGFGGYNMRLPQWQLGTYDRLTGEIYSLSDEQGSGMRPAMSANGRWMVFATRLDTETGLRLRDLRSGDDRWLLYPVQRDDQEAVFTRDLMPGSAFTPDSSALIASFDGKIWRIEIPSGEVSPIPFTAQVDQQLGPRLEFANRVEQDAVVARQIRHPRLSPDGSKVVFTAFSRIYVMDLPSGSPRRLTDADVGEHHPTWSPDGTYVAYVTWSDSAGGHVYRVPADGASAPEQLTRQPSFYSFPEYSPDGGRIVVVRGPGQERVEDASSSGTGGQVLELHWLPADGVAANARTTLVTPLRTWANPHFTADAERIFIYDRSDGLVSFRFDGTDRRAHLKVTGFKAPGATEAPPASAVMMGPDGKQAIAATENHLYLITVPMVGGDALTVSTMNPASAPVPMTKLTTVGGEFMAWAPDGATVIFALGRTLFVYDLEAARTAEIEARAEQEEAQAEEQGAVQEEEAVEEEDEEEAEEDDQPAYLAAETEIRIEADRHTPSGTVVLRGARIITMRGDEIIEEGDLVIEDNRVTAVGRSGEVEVPAGADVIDVAGRTIVPGFLDIHAHARPATGIHREQVWEYLANLAYGVTTLHDVQTSSTDVLAYADMVETGKLLGPRIFGTGPGVFRSENIKSLDAARDVLRRYRRYFGLYNIKMYMTGNRRQRQWVIQAANELGLLPTTEGGNSLPLQLTHVADGYPGIEHSFPMVPIFKDVVEFVAQAGTVYTPTLIVNYGGPDGEMYFYTHDEVHDDAKLRRFTPHRDIDRVALRQPWSRDDEYIFDDHAAVAADIVAAGGRVGIGGHGQRQGIQVHWEIWSMASGGMSNHDVLRTATIFGAEAIGYGQDLGSIEPGKLADLIVLERNPLDDIRNTNTIRYVVKNGEIFEGDTLDQIWPERKPLPHQYWWDFDPARRPGAPRQRSLQR